MKIRIISVTDGYHDPYFFFEDGRYVYGNEALYEVVFAPHEEHYVIARIWTDDLFEDEDENKIRFVENYGGDIEHNAENFEKLYEIYTSIYED